MNKEVNEKKKRYAIIITFLVLMICITGGTYAYFALTASNNSVTGSVGGASLNLTVTKVYPTSEHNNKNMIPQLESTLDEAISLEHKCVDGNGNVICQVYSATVTNQGSTSSVLNGTISFTGIENMPNLKWMRINDSNTIGTYSSSIASTDKVLFEEEKSFGANTSNTYYFVFWIDETGEVQTDSGDFRANIEFDSSDGGLTSTVRPSKPLLSNYIESLYDDSRVNSVYIAGNSSKQQVHLDSTSGIMKVDQGSTYGIEYRYYGATPNNYVEYNNELWRIISVSKVFSSEEDTVGETRVRIIKSTKIGDLAFDFKVVGSSSKWDDTTLNTELNGIYYNRTSGICHYNQEEQICDYSDNGTTKGLSSDAKSLIGDALWYLGALNGGYPDEYVDAFYIAERGNEVANSLYPSRWTGRVGLMYPSDYLYATDLSKCMRTSQQYGDEPINCSGSDWLVNGDADWFISPFFDYDGLAWHSSVSGAVHFDYVSIRDNLGVRPVVVLKSNVVKIDGDGSSGNPYKIALN